MYKIGLTGSIGSGKSTVSSFIKNRGIPVLDADKIARSLTEPDSPILSQLVEAFGEEILFENGELDRKKLAEIAFATEEKRKLLSEIVTLKVKAIMEDEGRLLEEEGARLAFFDVPLLFEYGMDEGYDEVWAVVAPLEIRYNRVMDREKISEKDFYARDAAQISQEEKIARSQVVINNNSDLESLYGKIAKELDRIKMLWQ